MGVRLGMRLDWAAMLLLYAVGVQTVAPAPSAQSTPPRAPPPRGLGSLPSFATAKSDPVVAALAHTQARPATLLPSPCPQQSVCSPCSGLALLAGTIPQHRVQCARPRGTGLWAARCCCGDVQGGFCAGGRLAAAHLRSGGAPEQAAVPVRCPARRRSPCTAVPGAVRTAAP